MGRDEESEVGYKMLHAYGRCDFFVFDALCVSLLGTSYIVGSWQPKAASAALAQSADLWPRFYPVSWAVSLLHLVVFTKARRVSAQRRVSKYDLVPALQSPANDVT